MFYHFRMDHTPDKHLSPNAAYKSVHAQARIVREAKRKVAPFLENAPSFTNTPTSIHWIVLWEKGHKKLDPDNLIKTFKNYQDSVAEALGINDVNMIPSVEQHRDEMEKGAVICLVSQKALETNLEDAMITDT